MKTKLKKEYQKAVLELSNGIKMEGRLIGANAVASGEMVFSTGMNAYSEAMTDPSYMGQILVFSFSLIGNYGIPSNEGDFFRSHGYESEGIKTQGIIVNDDYDNCFHYEKGKNLDDWMRESGVPGIAGIDTRYLVQMIRDASKPLFGRIAPQNKTASYDNTKYEFLKHFGPKDYADPSKYNLMPSVSVKKPVSFGKGKYKIALLDFGVKRNIIRLFTENDCTVTVYPWDSDVTKVDCDAWVLSNGPGDPKNTGDSIERVKKILNAGKPVLGICLGHQIMALAAGAKTRKLLKGHRGFNQPVFDTETRHGFMTSQNHSFEVNGKTIPRDWKVWFQNANDGTVEGLKHKSKPFMCTQFHPEASGGPNDTMWIIKDFIKLIRK